MKTTRSWLMLLLALLATVACLTEASSWIASSHSTDGPSWRINTSPDARSERGDRCDYSSDTLDGAETLKEDGFHRKPLCDKTVLVLSRQAESLSTLDPDFLASLPRLRSLIVPLHVNIARVKDIINTVIERSSLEELEILHSEVFFDLDHQTSLKRLAIDASALDRLPLLLAVEEMVLMNPQGDIVSSLERICPHGLSLLTLVGAHDDLHAIDTSSLSVGTRVAFVVTSPPQHELDELESVNFRRSSRASLSTISLVLDDTWTNATLDSSVCISDPSAVTIVALICPTTMTTKWFRTPTCVSTFPALTQITVTRCQMPAFNALPPTLKVVDLVSAYGTWTQREAGVDPNGPNSEYFDWSWLSSVPNLVTLSFATQPINGTLPNEFSHAKIAYWGLYTDATITNHLVGTISRDWFLRYPATLTLNLAYHGLTGTIPNYGMEQLTDLILTNNQFTHWPPLIINATAGFGAPTKLASVSLDNNNLVQIPSESDFQAMRLTFFSIQSNPSLSAPIPNIFATTTQRTSINLVTAVYASGCQFYGDLPEIPAYQAALYYSAPATLRFMANNNLFTGTIPSSWSSVKFLWLSLANNAMVGTMATIDSDGLVISRPLSDTTLFQFSSNFVTGPMFNISAMTSLSDLIVSAPNVDFCASYRAGFSYASKTLPTCSLTGNATMCPLAYPSTCGLYAAAPTAPVAPYSPPIPARQIKGYFYSSLPGYANFDIVEMEGTEGCVYLGSAGGSAQAGGLYMRTAHCNDTSLTVLVADGCGDYVKTFTISNTSYTTGEAFWGTMSSTLNGVTYSKFNLTCYNPTPSEALAPIPAVSPVTSPADGQLIASGNVTVRFFISTTCSGSPHMTTSLYANYSLCQSYAFTAMQTTFYIRADCFITDFPKVSFCTDNTCSTCSALTYAASNACSPISQRFTPLQATNVTCPAYVPIAPVAIVPAPSPGNQECSLPSPGASFVCIGVQWVSDGSVDVGTLSVPRSSVTIIQGNLTTPSLVIASATSTINVTGCTTAPDGTRPPITVTLTQEDLDEIIRRGGKLTTVLLQQSSECGAIGASVVNVDTRAIKSCKKIETNKISSSSTISMAFRVSNSGCNTWWIILVSVVCGVIILAIGVVVILAIVWQPFREKIRPFSQKRPNKSAIG